MADEPQIIRAVRLVLEVLWVIVRVIFEQLKALVKWVVPPEPKDVSEDIILITGAGHGIGRELALKFAKLGATIICVDINAKGNDETFSMIKSEKRKPYKYECDVTDRAAVMQLAEKVSKEVGEITILINNAGIMPCKPLLKHTETEIRKTMDINVNGNLWMIQAFLPSMIERNQGQIVAMSSMAGTLGVRNLVPYCGSKFASRGIMEALATELHEDPRGITGVKLTTICPFIVNTGLCHKPRVRFQALLDTVEPEDAAELIVDAIRREYHQITIPTILYYTNRLYYLLPPAAARVLSDFLETGVEAHD